MILKAQVLCVLLHGGNHSSVLFRATTNGMKEGALPLSSSIIRLVNEKNVRRSYNTHTAFFVHDVNTK